ncbi:hypothetical protein FOZ62_025870, partial [Perkinsus olseni]
PSVSSAAASPVTLDEEQSTEALNAQPEGSLSSSLQARRALRDVHRQAPSVIDQESDHGDARDPDEGLAQGVRGAMDATETAHGHVKAPAIVAVMITITSAGGAGTNVDN